MLLRMHIELVVQMHGMYAHLEQRRAASYAQTEQRCGTIVHMHKAGHVPCKHTRYPTQILQGTAEPSLLSVA